MKYLIILFLLIRCSQPIEFGCKESVEVQKADDSCNSKEEFCTEFEVTEKKCKEIDLNIMGGE